jgi:glycosyltransferase involved in cell wall biosynthesis
LANNFPKISIVTPSYNQGHFIEETIVSVLEQNYPNLEYIIIDGGSKDNSVEIIKKYEKHLAYWVSEKDKGQSDAINKGLKRSTGEIFNWLNSDDYYAANALKTVAELFADAKTEVVCGKSRIFGKDYEYTGEPSQGFDIAANTFESPRINQPATFFKMNIVREFGPLGVGLHYCMDLEWWMKYLFTHGKSAIRFTDEQLVNFREHENSKTIEQSGEFIEDKFRLYSGILAQKDNLIKPLDGYVFNADLSKASHEFVYRMTNSFFLNNAVLYYGQRKMDKVERLLPFIKERYLSNADRKLFSRIRFRSKYVPGFLFKSKE